MMPLLALLALLALLVTVASGMGKAPLWPAVLLVCLVLLLIVWK